MSKLLERIEELKSAALEACTIIEGWVICETQYGDKQNDPDWRRAERIRTIVAKPDLVSSNDDILDALEVLVKHVRKVGGYMVPEDQLALFKAESVLRDAGRLAE